MIWNQTFVHEYIKHFGDNVYGYNILQCTLKFSLHDVSDCISSSFYDVISDIDECSEINNPCYEPSSCIPVPAPSVLGTLQTDKASCSPCPAGTEDGDKDHPGTICLEKNGCLPNECSRYDECMDVTQNLAGTVGELNRKKYIFTLFRLYNNHNNRNKKWSIFWNIFK